MDTAPTPAASAAESPTPAAPAEAPVDGAGKREQAHLQAMADAEGSVAASDDVVAQAVHGAAPQD